jgi:ribosomal protein S18 acetylase RimI-like enzyme
LNTATAISFKPPDHHSRPLLAALAKEVVALDPWKHLGYTEEDLLSCYQSTAADGQQFIILVDGDVAGIVCLQHPWLRGVYIKHLVILPPFQGQGIGALALQHIEHHYAGETNNIWLLVSAFNQAGQGFYQRMGFSRVAVIDDLIIEGEDEILMRKRTTPTEG